MQGFEDEHPDYWAGYGPFQRIKHQLIRCYLNGWFPKLGTWAGRVIYVDTHAGRGRHVSGELGSPLVALTTLLAHAHRDVLLDKSEFRFLFIERDPSNLEALEDELLTLGDLPARVHVDRTSGDAFAVLSGLVDTLRRDRTQLAPAFVFVDPYGFNIPGSVLRGLMSAGRVELFINVIWRELGMAIAQAPAPGSALANRLDAIFDGGEWRTEINAADVETRIDQTAALLSKKVGARWWTSFRMVTGGTATRYFLVHLTNHDQGRDLIKDCMWKVCPDGGFCVRRSDDPNQLRLVEREPDLAALRQWVVDKLRERPHRWAELTRAMRPLVWRSAHLNRVIGELRRNGTILAEGFSGRFSPKANPLLRLPD